MKPKKQTGKVLSVFLVIIGILLVSLTAIAVFFFQKEYEQRKNIESVLQRSQANEVRLDAELKELKKSTFLLEEKNKEADEKINSLLDELELAEGLREELKNENTTLREKLDKEKQSRDELKSMLTVDIEKAQKTTEELKARIEKVTAENTKLKTENESLRAEYNKLENQIEQLRQEHKESKTSAASETSTASKSTEVDVEFENLITKKKNETPYVIPDEIPDGRILTVDNETEFVIIDIGKKHGVSVGKVLSIYRGQDYLGDIQVTRVHEEMSAADLIPPFSSKTARKNDKVVAR